MSSNGEARGDELPEQLRTPEGRNDDPDAEERGEQPEAQAAAEVPLEFDPERIVARTQGGGLVARGQAPARAAPLAPPRSDPSLAARAAAVGG